ncbi:ATP-binding protein [Streptomyces sp. NBC_01304]|uniref:ATP-binding protein n=1 Tax=Streptomyces sp. NBC_01304 TaxID=2903818 RepID=UPI002E0D4388|nr:ATP-binding protein [Streptomyces sp. NBC_01304]
MKAQIATPDQELSFVQLFSATPRGARLARRLALHQLDEWGIPHGTETSDAVASVIAELAANAVTHGHVPGRDFELRLVLDGVRQRLRVEVSDARADRDPALRRRADDAEGGRGLQLVDALAEDWGVRDRGVGKTVWAEVKGPDVQHQLT